MAGAGYKLFVNGNTLSSSDLNTYVQQQTVMVFASASARTTALASVLAEGMVSYRTDSHVFEVYNGSAWASAGTSSPLTTKGDLWGYNTTNARVPVGTDGQLLKADSTNALGVSWATVPSAPGNTSLIASGSFNTTSLTLSGLSSYTNLTLMILAPQQGPSYTDATWYCTLNGNTSGVYNWHWSLIGLAAPQSYGGSNTANTKIPLTCGYDISGYNTRQFHLSLYNCKNPGYTTWDNWSQWQASSAWGGALSNTSGAYQVNEAISSITFTTSTGATINVGSYYLYGN
jgi:hypothetical protein